MRLDAGGAAASEGVQGIREERMILAAVELAGVAADDMSVPALFMRADIIVKAVMVLLAAASVWSWAVIIDKQLQFGRLRGQARKFEQDFWAGRSLEELSTAFAERTDPMSRVFLAAHREFRDGRGAAQGSGLLTLNQRIDRVMSLVIMREVTKAERGLGVLASVGSASPFIGLFGTVWGIFNAFRGIAASGDANLAVVAGPIAEALFATAMGLIAAVPAVIFYNKFASDTSRFASQLEGFAEELSAILSRRLQERTP
jgi:biopolymer transport protein TolQ